MQKVVVLSRQSIPMPSFQFMNLPPRKIRINAIIGDRTVLLFAHLRSLECVENISDLGAYLTAVISDIRADLIDPKASLNDVICMYS